MENESNPEGLSTRVKKPVLLELKEVKLSIPVVKCVYERNATFMTGNLSKHATFYITHANSSSVFTVVRNNDSDIYQLRSGLHEVSYNSVK